MNVLQELIEWNKYLISTISFNSIEQKIKTMSDDILKRYSVEKSLEKQI